MRRDKYNIHKFMCIASLFAVLLVLIFIVTVKAAFGRDVTTIELREDLDELIFKVEVYMLDSDDEAVVGCCEYILNLLGLLEGQLDAIDAIEEYGGPNGND